MGALRTITLSTIALRPTLILRAALAVRTRITLRARAIAGVRRARCIAGVSRTRAVTGVGRAGSTLAFAVAAWAATGVALRRTSAALAFGWLGGRAKRAHA